MGLVEMSKRLKFCHLQKPNIRLRTCFDFFKISIIKDFSGQAEPKLLPLSFQEFRVEVGRRVIKKISYLRVPLRHVVQKLCAKIKLPSKQRLCVTRVFQIRWGQKIKLKTVSNSLTT